ncbi:hypothetical protein ACQQ2N_10770 [Dokdonella sp. MW10]|uniref:hypothetical protein n=1 Tax=Dokdonella sp. MW10 TaxID=2992926 RepID=UPI003F7F510E
MTSAPAIALELAPSRRLALGAGAVAVLAVVAIAASGMPPVIQLVSMLVATSIAVVSIRRQLRPGWTRVTFDRSGWQLVDVASDVVPVTLRGHARLGPLVSLDFAVPERPRFRFVVDRAAVDADAWRRLVLVLARSP